MKFDGQVGDMGSGEECYIFTDARFLVKGDIGELKKRVSERYEVVGSSMSKEKGAEYWNVRIRSKSTDGVPFSGEGVKRVPAVVKEPGIKMERDVSGVVLFGVVKGVGGKGLILA